MSKKSWWKFWKLSKKRKLPAFRLTTATGSAVASIAAMFLGDATGGAMTAAVIGALLGLAEPIQSQFKKVTAKKSRKLHEIDILITESFVGINASLRALVLMVLFFGLAYIAREFLDVLKELLGTKGIWFGVITLFMLFYFASSRQSKNVEFEEEYTNKKSQKDE